MRMTIAEIVNHASEVFNISRADLYGDARFNLICRPRHAAWFVAHELGHSYSAIGRVMGRHPTTVSHGIGSASVARKHNPAFCALVNELRRRCGSYDSQERRAA